MPTPSALREEASDQLLREVGTLSTAAMTRMESDKAWFTDLSAEDRSWVGMIVQPPGDPVVEHCGQVVGSLERSCRGKRAEDARHGVIVGFAGAQRGEECAGGGGAEDLQGLLVV